MVSPAIFNPWSICLKIIFVNSISILVQSKKIELLYIDSLKFKEIEIKTEQKLEFVNKDMFKPFIVNKLEIQQNQRFFNFK